MKIQTFTLDDLKKKRADKPSILVSSILEHVKYGSNILENMKWNDFVFSTQLKKSLPATHLPNPHPPSYPNSLALSFLPPPTPLGYSTLKLKSFRTNFGVFDHANCLKMAQEDTKMLPDQFWIDQNMLNKYQKQHSSFSK